MYETQMFWVVTASLRNPFYEAFMVYF